MIPLPPMTDVVANPVSASTLFDMVGWPVVAAAAAVVVGQVAFVVRLAIAAGSSARRARQPRPALHVFGRSETPAQPA